MSHTRVRACALVGAAVVVIAGCGGNDATSSEPAPQMEQQRAVATLEARSGSDLTGSAGFVQSGDGPVRIRVRVQGATPGLHGLHVHETG